LKLTKLPSVGSVDNELPVWLGYNSSELFEVQPYILVKPDLEVHMLTGREVSYITMLSSSQLLKLDSIVVAVHTIKEKS
jgi:hypothetical protein